MWSSNTFNKTEKAILRQAFDRAYEHECAHIIAEVQKRAVSLSSPQDVWELETFLYEQRRQVDQKYDYRYSQLIFVFGWLINEGWMSLDDLDGVAESKLAPLHRLLTFST